MYLSNRYPSSISPEQLIRAYKHGIFPMAENRKDEKIVFIDPEYRALIPISKFKTSKSLIRLAKKRPFKITMNKAFADVIRSCATINRTETWINNEIDIRKKYGPSNLFKIYSVYSSRIIEGVDIDYFRPSSP